MGAAAHSERGAAGVVQEDGRVLPRLRGRAESARRCPLHPHARPAAEGAGRGRASPSNPGLRPLV